MLISRPREDNPCTCPARRNQDYQFQQVVANENQTIQRALAFLRTEETYTHGTYGQSGEIDHSMVKTGSIPSDNPKSSKLQVLKVIG